MPAKRVLIIQQQAQPAQALTRHFRSRGDQVWEAWEIGQAEALFKQIRPHLILLDLHFPGEDWLEFLRHIQTADPKVKVILTNQYPDVQREMLAKSNGFHVFLRQPFQARWIEQALRRLEAVDVPTQPRQQPSPAPLPVSQPPAVKVPVRLKITLPYLILALLFALASAYIVTQVVIESVQDRFFNQLVAAGRQTTDWMVREEDRLLATLRLIANTQGIAEAVQAGDSEQLRLLSLPDVSRWWFEKILNLARGAGLLLRPLGKLALGADLPDNDAWGQVNNLFKTLDKVRSILADPDMSSLRLVINAEKMVIKETQRTYTYLSLYGYPTDAVICNRIIPDSVTDPYFAAWKDSQAQNLKLITEAFGELPLFKAPLFQHEMGGFDALRTLADALYGDSNPAQLLFRGQTHNIASDGQNGYYLRVPLPFADKTDMDVFRSTDELTLRVGPYRRNIVLPYALHHLEIVDAKFDESTLSIHFAAA